MLRQTFLLRRYAVCSRRYAIPLVFLFYWDRLVQLICAVLSTYATKVVISVLYPDDTGCVATPNFIAALLRCQFVSLCRSFHTSILLGPRGSMNM